MPRIPRKYSKNLYYHHIIVQGLNREYIFSKEENIKKYIEIILNKLKNSHINILAYCIMNNHAHFLIYSRSQAELSKFMQRINIAYSKYYNSKNTRIGYVFRDRYLSENILNQTQLFNCLCYIHYNPVKANIVNHISEYKYSSYNEFLGDKIILNKESLNLLFGNSKNFKYQVINIHNSYFNRKINFIDVKEKSIQEFINEIEKKYNKRILEIKEEKELLKDIIKQARNETDVTIRDLAAIFKVSKNTVNKYCND